MIEWISDLIQMGILATSAIGIVLILNQLNQNRKLKQSDHFLYFAEKYAELVDNLNRTVERTAIAQGKPARKVLEDFTYSDFGEEKPAVRYCAQRLISLYKTEYELWRFGSISNFHWKIWQRNFSEDGKTQFWRSFWQEVRVRYNQDPAFQRFMDKVMT